jgi:dihydropteroate synthase
MMARARVVEADGPAALARQLEELGQQVLPGQLDPAVFRYVRVQTEHPAEARAVREALQAAGGVVYGAGDARAGAGDLLAAATRAQYTRAGALLRARGADACARAIEDALDGYEAVPPPMRLGRHTLDFSRRAYVMGILNVTPDSFYDGGRYLSVPQAVERARRMAAEGADIIDIGGESARPGEPISVEEELARVLPALRAVAAEVDVPLSVETYKWQVAEQAIAAGATMVNDLTGLEDPAMRRVVADTGVAAVIMHLKDKPKISGARPEYRSLVGDIVAYFQDRVALCLEAGISRAQLCIDPGLEFDKTFAQNLLLMHYLGELRTLGLAILVAPSRKRFIGYVLDQPPEERLEGTGATVAFAIARGAHIVRVHDVREMALVARMTSALTRPWLWQESPAGTHVYPL